jgi:hypothetical protein
MKAYMFDPETGIYEGETFAEAATLENENGLTTIPPPAHEDGQVPVFDRQRKAWEIVPVVIARQLLKLPGCAVTENES